MGRKHRHSGGKRDFAQENCAEQQKVQRETILRRHEPGPLKRLVCCILGITLKEDAWQNLSAADLARIATDAEYEEDR